MPVFNLILISLVLVAITFAALGIRLLFNSNAKIEFQGCSNYNEDPSCSCINERSCIVAKVNEPAA